MKDPMEAFNKAAQKTVDDQNAAKKSQEEVATEEVVEEVIEEVVAEEQQEEVKEEVKEEESIVAEEEVPSGEEKPADESKPKEDDTTEEEQAVDDGLIQEDTVISDWDNASEEATKSTEFDFKSLASEVGFEANSKEEFLSKVGEIKAKADAPDPTAALPENLKKAIEIAGQDGNYLDYLGVTSVNYDAVDNLAIVQAHYNQMFTNPQAGTVDNAKVELIMDGMSDPDIEVKGIELKAQYKDQQAQRAVAIEAETTRNRVESDRQLQSVLNGLTEHKGFKYSPTHKKQLYDGITSGNMIAEMFHGNDGKMDMTKVVHAYSDFKFGDAQNKYLRQQVATKATKKVLDRISHKTIEPKTELPHREAHVAKDTQGKVAEAVRKDGAAAFAPVQR